jgi:hypothetical protein
MFGSPHDDQGREMQHANEGRMHGVAPARCIESAEAAG